MVIGSNVVAALTCTGWLYKAALVAAPVITRAAVLAKRMKNFRMFPSFVMLEGYRESQNASVTRVTMNTICAV
jgi:hypothetical protein